MSPRTGRPKIADPKNHDIKVRIGNDFMERLDEYCAKYGTTRAEAIRRGLALLLEEKEK